MSEAIYGHLLIRKKSDRSFESLVLVDFKHPEVHVWKGPDLNPFLISAVFGK